ncbi:MAG: class I SAM-dependent methyltransferase [Actinomycetota bacterium]
MRVTDPEENEVRALHSLVDFGGKRVLEIGCGDGRLTWRYAGEAASVTAVDPVATEIESAIAATPASLRRRVRFRVGDATTQGFRPGAYDLAILSYSL